MNPVTIIADLLRTIPPWARKTVLAAYAVAFAVVEVAQILEVSWDFDKINQILVYLGVYLTAQSGANITPPATDEIGWEEA